MTALTVKEILDKTVNHFKEYEIANPRLDAEVLLAKVLDMERINLYVNFDKPLKKEEIDKYRKFVIKRSKGLPVAYIIGEQEFMSLEFMVNQNVLIPRPETEHLIEAALAQIKISKSNKLRIVDVGTGSGAIIVSLVKLATNHLEGIGVDISNEALEVAQKNAIKHEVNDKIEFKLGDLLEPIEQPVDIIVSNPPYIPTDEIDRLQTEVKNEPMTALDGGEDGLDYYRNIIKQATKKLRKSGIIIFEVGINQAQDVAILLEEFNFENVEIIEDYAGIERVVLANYK